MKVLHCALLRAMERFVLRGDAAAALAESLADATPSQQKKRQRQTTIHHGDKVSAFST